jgi:hypothetical protein
MSLLAPLYIAGILAVSLPIVFHLIRRTPQGRQTFSSLMFLTPSPPRLTRRSRLDNLLLLLLRGLALALLAFAFARPLFYRQSDMNISEAEGRRIALVVDTSASMRRGDLWSQAVARADKVLDELEPNDEVALYTFDQRARPLLSFDEWNEQERSSRAALVRSRLAAAGPTWAATNLGDALATVADALADHSRQSKEVGRRQLVLISDLQQGSHIEPLQGYEWPRGVLLDVQSVALNDPTNAGVHLVESAAVADEDAVDRLRVRVSNEADSKQEQLALAWANEQGPLATAEPFHVYVPPGQSRIVRVPWPTLGSSADRLVLTGDAHDFDNTFYVVPRRQEQMRLVFLGDDKPDDVKGLLFYLQNALAETPARKVEIVRKPTAEAVTGADLVEVRLIVAASPASAEQAKWLRDFAEQGGTVLLALKDAAAGANLGPLLGVKNLAVEEAKTRDYALLSHIDFGHPLFAPFADPRFADFTKIRFWKHRSIRFEAASQPNAAPRVLASFDNGDPFLLEVAADKGRVFLMASGWQPDDTQLALSSKFVPLIAGMFPHTESGLEKSQRQVFDKVELTASVGKDGRTVHRPGGDETKLASDATIFDAADAPGIYRFTVEGKETPLAFNLMADESRTAPLAVEELEQRGARIGTQPTVEQLAKRERQARIFELENRQKLWRWLIVAVLAVLVIETALAGRLAHRTLQPQVST